MQITRSPIDDSVYVERELASQDQIKQALDAAVAAQRQWREESIARRAEYCLAMLEAFLDSGDEIAEQLCWMMGRPIRYAKGEVTGMVDRARHMIGIAEQSLAPIKLPDTEGFIRYIQREPLGVAFVIAPWNYPYLTAINSIIPALMAGNTVLLKHSAQTPLCAEQLARAFQVADLPAGVFQYLHLSHQDTEMIISVSWWLRCKY